MEKKEKIVSPEEENKLLRRKIQKLESDLEQVMVFANEEAEKAARFKKEIARLIEISMFSIACPTLYNKRFFDQELPRMVEMERRMGGNGGCYGIVYVDLNKLRSFNSRHGHDGGTRALCSIGTKLLKTVRKSDLVAHVSGDEFVVLFFSASIREGYKSYARINRAVRKVEVIFKDGSVDFASAMTALAIQSIGDKVDPADVCHKADLRLMAKKEKRDKREFLLH